MDVASAKVLSAVVAAIDATGRLNTTMSVSNVVDVLGAVLNSYNDIRAIANSTGLTWEVVNKTVTGIYLCVNSTLLSPKKEEQVWGCFQASTTTKKKTDNSCAKLEGDLNALVLSVLFLFSVLFVLVMSCIEKRKYRKKCCHGRPGSVIPLNMLDSYQNRFGNALAFGATASYCVEVLFGSLESVLGSGWGAIIAASPSYVGIFFKLLATVLIAMSAYPLFVCMGTKHKSMGSIFGIFYSALWISLLCFKLVVHAKSCLSESVLGQASKSTIAMDVLVAVPQLMCLLLLLLKFIRVLIKSVRRRFGRWDEDAEDVYDDFRDHYMYRHVSNLLKKNLISENSGEVATFKSKMKQKIYKWKPEFKYSTRVICAFLVSGIVLYILTVYMIWAVWYWLGFLLANFAKTKDFENFVKSIFNNDISMVEKVRTHVRIWTACFYVAIILSSLKTVFLFMNMLAWYRGHIMRLRRGDRSWLPTSIRTLSASPASLLASSMKYAGFQVGYVAWGFALFVLVSWLALSIVISFILYPLFYGQSSPILTLLYGAWPALLVSLFVALSQRLAAMFFFLQQRGKIISIDNRNAFHIMSYFMFYFNVFLGLISCLLRIIKSVIVGLLFLERVQKSLLPRAFEKMDPGYYAYIGYILIEHSHANPVLCVFFYLLNQHVKATHKALLASQISFMEHKPKNSYKLQKLEQGCCEKSPEFARKQERWRIVRNRWNLAYTLVNNPSLIKYRKGEDEESDVSENEMKLFDDEKKSEERKSSTPVIA